MSPSEPARFPFGRNWRGFSGLIDEERIASSCASLSRMLETGSLEGLTFLDVGCGSGLSSLAAQRLGASVTSFDYDADAVACTEDLRRRFGNHETWAVGRGSVLDPTYLASLGKFDIVYSWGVLHHTGDMWSALSNVAESVGPGGQLYIAIYNDQGQASRRWWRIKYLYNRSPAPVQRLIVVAVFAYFRVRPINLLNRLLHGHNPFRNPWGRRERGMSPWHDMIDWVGGFPFEVAKPEEVIHHLLGRGFQLARLKTCGGGLGCNEFVMRRVDDRA